MRVQQRLIARATGGLLIGLATAATLSTTVWRGTPSVSALPVHADTPTPCPSLGPCGNPVPSLNVAPQTPPVVESACPAPAEGTVCYPPSAEDRSSNAPPALPATHNGVAGCTGAPPAARPDSWVQYGSTQRVDYSQIGSGYTPYPPINGAEPVNLFPLPFIVRVDPAASCRAYRISADGTRIQRSLDSGRTWSTVLDGTEMQSRPQFRQIVIGGGPGAGGEILYASEQRNGDALVRSLDGGTTWQLADGTASSGANLVDEALYSVTASSQDPRIVYAVALACLDSARPRTAPACVTTDAGRYDTGYIAPRQPPGNIGAVRLYVSRDAGNDWVRLDDPNVDATNGVPENCDGNMAAVVSDPYSTAGGGVLHDHVWILFNACGTDNWFEGTWNGTDYGFQASKRSAMQSQFPFTVVRTPTGERLISIEYQYGYSDDDGLTWTPIHVNELGSGAVGADAAGDLFTLDETEYYADDQDRPWSDQAQFLQPNPVGGYDVRVGARLPVGASGFAAHGSGAAVYDQHRRALFDWPTANPLTPPVSARLAQTGWSAYVDSDSAGNFYVMVGTVCYDQGDCAWDGRHAADAPGSPTSMAEWRLMRYTPPRAISSLTKLLNAYVWTDSQATTSAPCANSGRCDLVPLAQCAIAGDPGDRNGTLAFDGAHLFYSVTGETVAQPDTAVIHWLTPGGCAGAGTRNVAPGGDVQIHFDPAEYAAARLLAPISEAVGGNPHYQMAVPDGSGGSGNPTVDTMAYDAAHDRLYFTLSPYANGRGGWNSENQISTWEADLGTASNGGVPPTSVAAHLVTVDSGYCPDDAESVPGQGSQTLAVDLVDSALWDCLPGHPGKFDMSGNSETQPCAQTVDLQGGHNTGTDIYSWSMEGMKPGAPHRAFLWEQDGSPNVVLFDLSTCTENRGYQLTAPALQGQPARAGHGSQSLACDPVTFGAGTYAHPDTSGAASLEQTYGTSFSGAPSGAVLWSKVGTQLTAWAIPDNGDAAMQKAGIATDAQTCRLPVTLASATPTSVAAGQRFAICATLTIDGPGAAAPSQAVEISLDGAAPRTATFDGQRYCLEDPGLAAGYHPVEFTYSQPNSDPSDVAFYSAAPVSITIVAGGPAAPPPTPCCTPQPPVPPKPAPVAGIVPVPQLAPAADAIGGTGTPPQVTNATGQPAAAEQREEEREVALAYSFPDQEDAAQESADGTSPPTGDGTLSMSALDQGNGGRILLPAALSTLAVTGALGVVVAARWSRRRSPALAHARRSTRRSRP